MANTNKSGADAGKTTGATAIVTNGCYLKGELVLRGPLHISGEIEGRIKTPGQVLISAQGKVSGTIEAKHLALGGSFDGTAFVGSAELLSGSMFKGDLYTSKCSCEVGGRISGRMHPPTNGKY